MITILGNGPVGLIVERICQLKNWEYTLIGPSTYPNNNKLILLTSKNLQFLKSLGFAIPEHKSFPQLRVSSYLSKIPCYLPQEPSEQALCYGIWLQDLVKALSTYSKPTYDKVISGSASPTISLSTPDAEITTDYLIGCDGSSSLAAKIADITYKNRPAYHCLVIPANIDGNLLIQKHSSRHIIAAIPDPKGSIVISSQYPLNNINPSLESLRRLIGPSISIHSIEEPIRFTLEPKLATQNYKNNILLLGNAALTIEPVAAKGLNHAINNLKQLYALDSLDNIEKYAQNIHSLNSRLFHQMHHIVNPSAYKKLVQKVGFYSQLFSPLFQDKLLHFGDPYD